VVTRVGLKRNGLEEGSHTLSGNRNQVIQPVAQPLYWLTFNSQQI